MNRRTFFQATASGIVAVSIGSRLTSAQETAADVQLTLASFIRTPASATPVASPVASPVATPVASDIVGYILGDIDAPHTLTLMADYRCPHCRSFHAEFEPSLITDFVVPGKLRLEVLDFPVVGVPSFDALSDDTMESVQAAEAAACAAEQGAFIAYREWLYSGPNVMNVGDFVDDNLIAAAAELGLDVDQFTTSLTEGVYEEDIIASFIRSLDTGAGGTPALSLDGGVAFYPPASGYAELKVMLDEEIGAE